MDKLARDTIEAIARHARLPPEAVRYALMKGVQMQLIGQAARLASAVRTVLAVDLSVEALYQPQAPWPVNVRWTSVDEAFTPEQLLERERRRLEELGGVTDRHVRAEIRRMLGGAGC